MPARAPGPAPRPVVGALTAVAMRVRADLRRRWASWLLLALFIGLFAGAVVTIGAGARRTDTAYPRLTRFTTAPDFVVLRNTGDQGFATFSNAAIEALPQVRSTAEYLNFSSVKPSDIEVVAPADAAAIGGAWGRKILRGRAPDPAHPDEASISFTAAEKYHLKPGDDFRVTLVGKSGTPAPVTVHVVGVDATPSEFPPHNSTDSDTIWVGPGFAHANPAAAGLPITTLRLAHGAADLPAIEAALIRLGHGKPNQSFAVERQAVNTQRAIHVQAVALWVLAGLLALTSLMIVAQLLARQSAIESDGYRELHTLGLTTRGPVGDRARSAHDDRAGQRRRRGAGRGRRFPALPARARRDRRAPPGLRLRRPGDRARRGRHAGHGRGGGRMAVLAGVAPCHGIAGARPHSGALPVRHPADPDARRVPVTAATGVAFALDPGRGSNAVPVRSTIAASVLGVAVLTGALVFSSSLSHLLHTPKLYGTNWDAYATSNQGAGVPVAPALPVLERDFRVASIAEGYTGAPMIVDGQRVDGMAIATVKGDSLLPLATEGRQPVGDREVMLGIRTMQALHVHIGDRVTATLSGVPASKRFVVVGAGVFPSLSDSMGLGKGMALTIPAVRAIVGAQNACHRRRAGSSTFRPAHRPRRRHRRAPPADLRRTLADRLQRPHATDRPGQLRAGVEPAVHRRRAAGPARDGHARPPAGHVDPPAVRGDLAVLKVIGFSAGQLRRTVAWQATTVALGSVVLGIPVGLIIGRWIWITFAQALGAIVVTDVEPLPLLVMAVSVLVLANLVALIPADPRRLHAPRWPGRSAPAR